MSKTENTIIKCPECGFKFEAQYWVSINTSIDPSVKEELIVGDLFVVKCPNCKKENFFIYPTLYHDMDGKMMIYFVTSDEEAMKAKKTLEESILKSSTNKLLALASADYQYRIVYSPSELREKAMILDCGLDDRVVELLKVVYSRQIARKTPKFKVAKILFNSRPDIEFTVFAEDGSSFDIELDINVYNRIAEERSKRIAEKSKNCYYIDQQWATEFLGSDGVYNHQLPLQDVHYGGEYFGFSDGLDENMCLCSCQKQSITNRIKMFMQHKQYDTSVNPEEEKLLKELGLPEYFEQKIRDSKLPYGEHWLDLLRFKEGICHVCNGLTPDYKHSLYIYTSEFERQWGHYLESRYFHYGIDKMEHWGVYFVEEVLTPEHKKLLCPTKAELINELPQFPSELERLFGLSKEERDVLLYYRSNAKVLREKKLSADYLALRARYDRGDFVDQLQKVIHKRFMAVSKMIRNEFKSMLPRT